MTRGVIIDTNLLILLLVGSADVGYIAKHRRTREYDEDDFDNLVQIIGLFSEIVLVPHVLAEASNLARQTSEPMRSAVQDRLARLVRGTQEAQVASLDGVRREEFAELGLTDAVILHLCAPARDGPGPSLLTVDQDLAVRAEMAGHNVLNFEHWREA